MPVIGGGHGQTDLAIRTSAGGQELGQELLVVFIKPVRVAGGRRDVTNPDPGTQSPVNQWNGRLPILRA